MKRRNGSLAVKTKRSRNCLHFSSCIYRCVGGLNKDLHKKLVCKSKIEAQSEHKNILVESVLFGLIRDP